MGAHSPKGRGLGVGPNSPKGWVKHLLIYALSKLKYQPRVAQLLFVNAVNLRAKSW
jgi:hypothetical protein